MAISIPRKMVFTLSVELVIIVFLSQLCAVGRNGNRFVVVRRVILATMTPVEFQMRYGTVAVSLKDDVVVTSFNH